MRLGLSLLLSGAVLVGLLVAWKVLHPVHTYRFRLTIDVEKDGAWHSGSSVIELRTRRQPFLSLLPEVPEWASTVRGEAVFVDLGAGDHVIALLVGHNHGMMGTDALPSRALLGDKLASAGPPGLLDTLSVLHRQTLRGAEGKTYTLDETRIPPLIRFTKSGDPNSVERVDPAAARARLEITRDEVTEGIIRHLPWLDRFTPDRPLDQQALSVWKAGDQPFSTARHLTYSNFISRP